MGHKVEMNPDGKGWIKLFAQWCLETPRVDLGPFSKAGQVKGSVRPNGKRRLMAGDGR